MADDADRQDKPSVSPRLRPVGKKSAAPKVFECKLCHKVFESEEEHPTCPECDSNDVERMG